MRSLGPSLILGGALATAAAMFLPFRSLGGQSFTWWEYGNGLDIVLLAACVASAGLALVALTAGHPSARQLAGIAAAMTFGLAFAPVPGAIDYSEGARAGLWIVAGISAIALAGAVVSVVLPPGARQPPSGVEASHGKWGWIALLVVGIVAVAGLALANPFGDDDEPTAPTTDVSPDVLDASAASAFAQRWARARVRPGERPTAGCAWDGQSWPPRFECDIRYRERPLGYKVIRRRSSEVHIVAVDPEVAYYTEDGKPSAARDRGGRNRWRVVSAISLGGESKLERTVRSALGYEVEAAGITRVRCRRQSGRSYSCTANLRSRRCVDARVRDDRTLTIDEVRFEAVRRC